MLKEIFWDMYTISHTTEVRAEIEYTESEGENGEIVVTERSVQRTYLIIQVTHKTADEAANQYGFTNEQKEQLNELLLPENQTMWNDVLYGLGGQGDLVAVALSQVGNVGGETYWRWYGFDERVDWCATFVSWCANECGYLENGVLPSFAVCYAGEDWFKSREQWQDNTYTPNLVIKCIDRLARNYDEILDQWRYLTKEKNVAIVILDMPLLDTRKNKDLTGTLIADIVLQPLSYVAQTERELIRRRQKEGIAAAKARGVKFGRIPIALPEEFEGVRRLWEQGRLSAREAAKELCVSHNTFLKWARREEKGNNINLND